MAWQRAIRSGVEGNTKFERNRWKQDQTHTIFQNFNLHLVLDMHQAQEQILMEIHKP